MKIRIGLFLIAFITYPYALVVNSTTAHASSCTFTSQTAIADGQVQQVPISGCRETVPASTGPLGALTGGFLNASQVGVISGDIVTSGNATINLGGQQAFTVTTTLPSFFSPAPNIIQIGNIKYDVSTIDIQVKGDFVGNVFGQATGAFIQEGFDLPSYPGASANVTCGNAFTVCGGVNQAWTVTQDFGSFVVSVIPISFQFDVSLSEDLQLTTVAPNSNKAVINAADPLDITSMELLDADGVPIPGVTFVGDDGTIFQDAADLTTPVPAALPLFATGLGAMGLFGWRRKRKASGLATA